MVPDVPRVPRVGARCSRNRAKHNSDARGKDQNFTHHVALFIVPPALLVVGITPRSRSWFHRATVTNDCAWNKTRHVAIATGAEGECLVVNDLEAQSYLRRYAVRSVA